MCSSGKRNRTGAQLHIDIIIVLSICPQGVVTRISDLEIRPSCDALFILTDLTGKKKIDRGWERPTGAPYFVGGKARPLTQKL